MSNESANTPVAHSVFPSGAGCEFAGPGRGDCSHFVGLPGKSVPGQHDGPDDTVDVYGKPNGWCWFCWKSKLLDDANERIWKLHNACLGVLNQYVDLVNSGDCGAWNPEEEAVVIAAREAIEGSKR